MPNNGGEAEGLSDAGIETFRENPFAAVARETGQNSRDARDDTTKPVVLRFDVVSLPADAFPSIEKFREAANLCLEKSEAASREKETGFFRNAVSALKADELKILRIADFNTKGVRGPCVEGRPFHTLAKTDGMSVKDDVSSGGSFGIGKNATFALSDIQTVFVSTMYEADGQTHSLCMGKTQFISHTDNAGNERRRKGYWGKVEGYMPVDTVEQVPQWLRRKEQGTSLFSVCLRETRTDWRHEMTAAILINFFCAIERQEMEFELDNGSILINRNTIQALFKSPEVNEAVDQLNVRHSFDSARKLHECLIDKQTASQVIEVPELGKVRMHALLRDGLRYTVGIVRNGMYITDNLAYFNEPFKRFPLHKEFAVIIEPESAAEGEWFRRLENPRHDNLSAERITDPALRAQGERAFSRLAREIRSRIRKVARSQPVDSIELYEMNEFFVTEGFRTEDDAGTETDPRAKVPTKMQRTNPKRTPPAARQFGSPGDPPGPGPNPNPEPGPGPGPVPPGPGPRPRPRKVMRPIELVSERALIQDRNELRKRRLIFTSPVDTDVIISTDASGLNAEERLAITAASIGKVSDDTLEITCEAGKRVSVDFEFDVPYGGPFEISAYEIVDHEEEAAS
ncbi:MAG: hypothetical protein ACFB01_05665 [Cohaesibacteraceae bacterium]